MSLYDCLIISLYDCLIVWLYDCLITSLYDCLIGNQWLCHYMIVWLSHYMMVWLYDCQNYGSESKSVSNNAFLLLTTAYSLLIAGPSIGFSSYLVITFIIMTSIVSWSCRQHNCSCRCAEDTEYEDCKVTNLTSVLWVFTELSLSALWVYQEKSCRV